MLKINIENISNFLPEFMHQSILIMVIFIIFMIATIIVVKNYIFVMKDIYLDSVENSRRVIFGIQMILIILAFVIPITVFNRDILFSRYTFLLDKNEGMVSVVSYSGNKNDIVIPSKIFIWDVTAVKLCGYSE